MNKYKKIYLIIRFQFYLFFVERYLPHLKSEWLISNKRKLPNSIFRLISEILFNKNSIDLQSKILKELIEFNNKTLGMENYG